jgi:hypothetical protein
MKKNTILSLLVILLAVLTSCSKDETKAYLSENPIGPKITAPASNQTVVLNSADKDNLFQSFAWTAADYGFPASIQYLVQFSKNADMSRAKTITSVNLAFTCSFSNLAFDQFLLASLKLTPNVATKVYYRVVASTIGLPSTIYPAGGATTEIRTMTVTPFNTPIDIKSWGIVGSATPNGWDGPDYVMDDGDAQGQYEATVDLKVGEIKFRFNNDWGLNLGGTPAALTQGGANVVITEAGKYKITLTVKNTGDVYTGSYTITKL